MSPKLGQQQNVKTLVMGIGAQGCKIISNLEPVHHKNLATAYIDLYLHRPDHPNISLNFRVDCTLHWSSQENDYEAADSLHIYWQAADPDTERAKIRAILQGINLLILVTGNDNGSGIIFEVARIARSMGIIIIGVICDTTHPLADVFGHQGVAAERFDEVVDSVLDYNLVTPEEMVRIFKGNGHRHSQ